MATKPEVYRAAGIEPRPRESDEVIRKVAVEAILVEVMRQIPEMDNDKDRDGVREDLMAIAGTSMDGYKLCRELERNHHWDCDSALVEIMGGLQWRLSDACKDAVKKWVAFYQVTPFYEAGQKVAYDGAEGIILDYGTAWHPGCYCIQVPSKGHGPNQGYVVAWEEIDPAIQTKGTLPATIDGPLFEVEP